MCGRTSALAVLLCASFAAAQCAPVAPTATASNGVFYGSQTMLPDASHPVNQFYGIPFAVSPPVRFMPPQEPVDDSTPRNATTLPPACPQEFPGPAAAAQFTKKIFDNPPVPDSEDCLYLNVWAPAARPLGNGFAVMFWIYGGALELGTGSFPAYNGASFASFQEVIIVTHNYRTNVFGFSTAPQIRFEEQNAGFLDQRLALEWVYKNIAAFGGDPEKITVFGQSSGGYSTAQLAALPPKEPKIQGVIIESYRALSTGPVNTTWTTLAKALGCGSNSDATQFSCMQSKPYEDLLNYTSTNSLAFGPVFNNVTAVASFFTQFKSGIAAHIPIIAGSNLDDGSFFATVSGVGYNATEADYTKALQALKYNSTQISAIQRVYNSSTYGSPFGAFQTLLTELKFQCTAATYAQEASAAGLNVHRYLYNATFPNLELFPGAGAFHTAELFAAFGTYPADGSTEEQRTLSRYMQRTWASFAKNGGDSVPWPAVSSGKIALIQSTGEVTVAEESVDGNCLFIDRLDGDTSR